jgi:hypothetical protein
MEDNKQPGQDLSAEQVASISGGDGTSCPAPSVVIGPVTVPEPVGASLVGIYEGFVEVTSHIIERLANTAK